VSTTSYLYRNAGGFPPLIEGIHRIQLRRSLVNPSLIKFTILGKNGSYAVNPANLPLKATVVLNPPFAANNQCGEAVFPGPRPICTYSPAGQGVVKCK
jgi:hypothetical protein